MVEMPDPDTIGKGGDQHDMREFLRRQLEIKGWFTTRG